VEINIKLLFTVTAVLTVILGCSEEGPASPGQSSQRTLYIFDQPDTHACVGDTLILRARARETSGDSVYYDMENILMKYIQMHPADTDFDPVTGEFRFYPADEDREFQLFLFRAFNTSGDVDSTKFYVNVSYCDAPPGPQDSTIIIDHRCCDIDAVPRSAIQGAIDNLVIAYGHSSHGSQLVTGMDSLAAFLGDDLYNYSSDGADNTLRLIDRPFGVPDLGNPDGSSWEAATRTYLDSNRDVNVVIWAWCGQLRYASESYVNNYLSLMSGLESDYPGVRFVYMTGHLTGDPPGSNIFTRNDQIRDFCTGNGCVLYDFADIESYDPDGNYYADMDANDNCDYDSDNDGYFDANWAVDWQNRNPGEWYDCIAAHTRPLNANLKAYAAWHLWARLAGWDGN
jgi:hypothetical protein